MSQMGSLLQQKRSEMGLSQIQVSEQLRIPLPYLNALELGDYKSLPGSVYSRAYLVSLCKLYQLDQTEVLKNYTSEMGETPKHTPSGHLMSFNTHGESLKAQKRIPFTPIFIVLVVLASVFIALKLALKGPTVEAEPLSSDSMTTSESQMDSLAIAAQNAANPKDTSKIEAKPETRILVSPRSEEAAILRIRYNEDSLQTRIIRKGNEAFTLNSPDTIELKISYPNRAELQLNDSIIPVIPRGKYFKVFNGSILP